MEHLKYKLRLWWSQFLKIVDGFFFSLRLKRLNSKYGSIEAAMAAGERLMLDMTADDEKILRFSMILTRICEHYKIEPFDTRLGQLYGDLLHTRLSCKEFEDEIFAVVLHEAPALQAHLHLLENGDISDQKYKYFGPPPPFETMEAWLISIQ